MRADCCSTPSRRQIPCFLLFEGWQPAGGVRLRERAGHHEDHEIWAWLKQMVATDSMSTRLGHVRAYRRGGAGAGERGSTEKAGGSASDGGD